jgi:hypothetical protein
MDSDQIYQFAAAILGAGVLGTSGTLGIQKFHNRNGRGANGAILAALERIADKQDATVDAIDRLSRSHGQRSDRVFVMLDDIQKDLVRTQTLAAMGTNGGRRRFLGLF